MTFRVTILGSSSASPTPERNPSAHVLNVHEQFFLIDCGEGTQQRMRQFGLSPLKIQAVFITHLHGDHLYGIFGLISTLGLKGRTTPLHIYAPRPFDEILATHLRYFEPHLPYSIAWHDVDTRSHALIYENKAMEVWSIPLRHRLPTAGYLFKEKMPPLNIRHEAIEHYGLNIAQCVAAKRGDDLTLDDGRRLNNTEITYRSYTPRSYAYLSDTSYSAHAAELIEGVDLLYHEATFRQTEVALARTTGHSTAQQAATVALKAHAKRLLLGHFSARYKDVDELVEEARQLFPATEAVREGCTYDLPIERLKNLR